MIDIKDKKDCCGCTACVESCPKQCISMLEDNEGFLYPQVDLSICINCRLCEKVCPVINRREPRKPIKVYAAVNPDEEIRMQSSSGGIFTPIAEKVLKNGGVVFGAKFNSAWTVEHGFTETIDGLAAFRGSKYVQSDVGKTYRQAETFLKAGRRVLFSGTPCQIAGLKRFLRKEYENLLTVDVVCHGVPSPLVWREYLKFIRPKGVAGKNSVLLFLNKELVITSILFRNKKLGWKKVGFEIRLSASKADKKSVLKSGKYLKKRDTLYFFEPISQNVFMQGFLKNIYLRPSCYACPARSGRSGSDISLADYWKVWDFHPEMFDDKGTSCVMANTVKGQSEISSLNLSLVESDYKCALSGNICIEQNVEMPPSRSLFWDLWSTHKIGAINKIIKSQRSSLLQRVGRRIKRLFSK